MEGLIPTATLPLPHHAGLSSHLDGDNHSYCTFTSLGDLGTPRHSLDTHHRYQKEEDTCINKHSLLVGTKQKGNSPLFSWTINGSPLYFDRESIRTYQRSLIDTATTLYNEMTTLVTEAPGSPPGLTGSKSSQSSSFRSSSLSGTHGILSDLIHFEDIGLEEEHHSIKRNESYMEKPLRPLPRNVATDTGGSRGSAASMTTMRELTNAGKGRPLPRLQGPVKGPGPTHSLILPNGKSPGPRRGLRSPSTPSLAMTAMSNHNRSRSPSPNPLSPVPRPIPRPSSPRKPGLAPSRDIDRPPARRGSWQPSRRSIKELEDEYDDLDEDLPDDASLWNVPLSPRMPTERTTISPTVSPRASPRASPERPNSLRNSLGMHMMKPPRTAPALNAHSPLQHSLDSPPTSPSKPAALVRGASTGTMPDHFDFPPARTKSWNVALSELSEEAKTLTEAFENHAVLAEKRHEEAVQSGESVTRPSMEQWSRSKSSTAELPPLRMNNVMIDPLPISKEKEKVLSRTRPSWLPPKDQKEERKHLREYQRMMESSLEAEKRRAAKVAHNQFAKDDTKSALLRIWEEHVLPHWDQVIREPRTRELWWRGVAPKSRARVWQKAIGNDLALTEVTFTKALRRAKEMEAQIRKLGSEEPSKEKAWFDAIRRDVKVTFPELNIFQPTGPLYHDLIDVLMAYSMYRSDVGYSHGTHLIAGQLRLQLTTPSDTFSCLCNLLNRPLPLAFLTGDPSATAKAYQLTDGLLLHKLPHLHSHLFSPSPQGLGLSAHEVLEPMMRTLFLGPGTGLGLETASRVWDVMVFDGDGVIIRTAVALLGALEGKLYGGVEEVLGLVGWRGGSRKSAWDVGNEEEFMARVRGAGKEEKEKN